MTQLLNEAIEHGKVDCPIIDMHGHWGPFYGIYFPKPYGEGIVSSMARCGIVLNVFSSHAALHEDFRGNLVTLKAVEEYPEQFRGYVVYNPNESWRWEDCRKLFEKDEFVGFKIHPASHSYPLDGKNYEPLFEYANSEEAIVLSHTWAGETYGAAPARRVVEKYPQMKFLMGHCCYGQWEEAAQIAADFPNAYLELTAAYAVGGVVTYLVERAGSEKILFGTDSPWFDPHYPMGCILFAHISDEDRRNIFYRNAQKILGKQVLDANSCWSAC